MVSFMQRRYASIAAKCMFHCARERREEMGRERKTSRFGRARETSDTDDADAEAEVVPNYQIADKLLFPRSKTEGDGKICGFDIYRYVKKSRRIGCVSPAL